MYYDYNERYEHLIGHWWLSLIVGLMAIALGFIVLVNPVASYLSIAIWLGIMVFVSGIVGLWQSFTSNNHFVHRGWVIVASIADIFIGIALMLNILLSASLLPVLLGVWMLYRGMTMFMQGVDLRNYRVSDAGWVIFGATLLIAISIAILLLPVSIGAAAVVSVVSVGFILYGLTMLSLSFKLREVHRRAKALQ
ncbi:MAG: DUF308 domain-containing protein [Alistipes sp.]|nr:DUF308 domain-containing protein [Alistipes sp.]